VNYFSNFNLDKKTSINKFVSQIERIKQWLEYVKYAERSPYMVTMYHMHTIEQEEDGYQICRKFGLK
jgi:hypothetical protein